MARPQTEDGYTRIANELLDAILRFGFSKRQFAVLLAVVRKTYGYNKKADEVSAFQVTAMTGIPRQHVTAALVELAGLNVIVKAPGRHSNSLAINKDYDTWGCPETGQGVSRNGTGAGVPKQDRGCPETGQAQVSRNGTVACPETGQLPVPKRDTQKTTPKDNSKRQGIAREKSAPSEFPITDRMRAHAKRKGLPNGRWLEEETEAFLDWHRSHGSKFSDWEAAWRNWLRIAVKRGQVPGASADLLDKVTYADSND